MVKKRTPIKRRRARLRSATKGVKGGVGKLQQAGEDAIKVATKEIGAKRGMAMLAGGTAGLAVGVTIAGIAGMVMTNRRIKEVATTARHVADVLEQEAHDLKEVAENERK